MPLLVLPLRMTPDTNAIRTAAQTAGWNALRLTNWLVLTGLTQRHDAIVGPIEMIATYHDAEDGG